MIKTIKELKQELLRQMHASIERIHEHVSQAIDAEWDLVNDETASEELPVLVNSECEVTRRLARIRLAGKSVTGTETYSFISDMMEVPEEKIDIQFQQGELWLCGELMKKLGMTAKADVCKMWAFLDPYS